MRMPLVCSVVFGIAIQILILRPMIGEPSSLSWHDGRSTVFQPR